MTDHPVKRRKKLIEVAIPLEAINAASAREKSIRRGHPSTLHLWWARRPLAAARAVIFCQMVDDPSAVPEEFPTEEDQENERLRLFALISELVTWENTTNDEVLNRARAEIRRSWKRCCADNADHPEAAELFNPEKLPGFHDPFAGGGALPLEAQRLGLDSYASDLNPVAVLINKAMIEIPPKFAGQPPVNPESRSNLNVRQWEGAQGLAEDVQHYGKWIFDEAKKRIGYLYPKIAITAEIIEERVDLSPYAGRELTPIAWLWARTVKSPDPAFAHIHVPLISSFNICTKSGSEHYVEPIVADGRYDFVVRRGKPSNSSHSSQGTKQGRGSFRCIMSGASITSEYIREEASANRVKERLMAVVAEGERSRVYLSPTEHQEEIALKAMPTWKPETEFTQQALGFRVGNYGMTRWSNLFTNRQLSGLSMLASLVCEVREVVAQDTFQSAKLLNAGLASHGSEFAKEYADAVVTYLSFAVSKVADRNSALNTWASLREHVKNTFTRQALSMTWDFAECNILSQSSGNFFGGIETISSALSSLGHGLGRSVNADAAS